MRTFAGVALLIGALVCPTFAVAADWEEVFEEDGIKVWRQEVEGTDFVMFRGRGLIKAPIITVAAVVRDADRESEWMENCVDACTIRFLSATDALVYHRTGSPAPFVSDRDMVLKTSMTVDPVTKTVLATFSQTTDPKYPEKEGVVRMPMLKGHWRMRQVDASTTELEYQVLADPGGSLPAWLVNLVSRKLPFHTVRRMRDQVKVGGYDKHETILGLALDWTGFEPVPQP